MGSPAINAIANLMKQIEQLEEDATATEALLPESAQLLKEANGFLKKMADRPHAEIGIYQHCPDSGFEYCAYDAEEDPCRDCCLFCGQPEERK